jgi:hypothetical protein
MGNPGIHMPPTITRAPVLVNPPLIFAAVLYPEVRLALDFLAQVITEVLSCIWLYLKVKCSGMGLGRSKKKDGGSNSLSRRQVVLPKLSTRPR